MQALADHHTDLDPVEPARVFRLEVELEPVNHSAALLSATSSMMANGKDLGRAPDGL